MFYFLGPTLNLITIWQDIVGFHHCSGLKVACSENMSSSTNQNYDIKRKTISRFENFDDDSSNLVIKGDGAYVSKVDKEMTQVNLLGFGFIIYLFDHFVYSTYHKSADIGECIITKFY